MVGIAQLAEHLTVDQVVEGSSPFAHPINVRIIHLKSTSDLIYGIGTFLLKEFCAAFYILRFKVTLINLRYIFPKIYLRNKDKLSCIRKAAHLHGERLYIAQIIPLRVDLNVEMKLERTCLLAYRLRLDHNRRRDFCIIGC